MGCTFERLPDIGRPAAVGILLLRSAKRRALDTAHHQPHRGTYPLRVDQTALPLAFRAQLARQANHLAEFVEAVVVRHRGQRIAADHLLDPARALRGRFLLTAEVGQQKPDRRNRPKLPLNPVAAANERAGRLEARDIVAPAAQHRPTDA